MMTNITRLVQMALHQGCRRRDLGGKNELAIIQSRLQTQIQRKFSKQRLALEMLFMPQT